MSSTVNCKQGDPYLLGGPIWGTKPLLNAGLTYPELPLTFGLPCPQSWATGPRAPGVTAGRWAKVSCVPGRVAIAPAKSMPAVQVQVRVKSSRHAALFQRAKAQENAIWLCKCLSDTPFGGDLSLAQALPI